MVDASSKIVAPRRVHEEVLKRLLTEMHNIHGVRMLVLYQNGRPRKIHVRDYFGQLPNTALPDIGCELVMTTRCLVTWLREVDERLAVSTFGVLRNFQDKYGVIIVDEENGEFDVEMQTVNARQFMRKVLELLQRWAEFLLSVVNRAPSH